MLTCAWIVTRYYSFFPEESRHGRKFITVDFTVQPVLRLISAYSRWVDGRPERMLGYNACTLTLACLYIYII